MPKSRRSRRVDSTLDSSSDTGYLFGTSTHRSESSTRSRKTRRSGRSWHRIRCFPWDVSPNTRWANYNGRAYLSDLGNGDINSRDYESERKNEKLSSRISDGSRSASSSDISPPPRRAHHRRERREEPSTSTSTSENTSSSTSTSPSSTSRASSSTDRCSICSSDSSCDCDSLSSTSYTSSSCTNAGDYWGDGWNGRCTAKACSACDRNEDRDRKKNGRWGTLSPIAEEREPIMPLEAVCGVCEKPGVGVGVGVNNQVYSDVGQESQMVVLKGWQRLPWIFALLFGCVREEVDCRGEEREVVKVPAFMLR